ncbi:hypothetical protein DFH06DRAFT_1472254 [Mycena polygramma]|nr:hypothetical protein DFH06DRAFT_1472254 [Mycena polygramma]
MNTLLSFVLLALTVVAVPPVERAADTNFSATCVDISFDASNYDLTATCQNADGIGSTTTTIGLDSCVGNINGELAGGSDFSSSCSEIEFRWVSLNVACSNPYGIPINTSLDLNSVLSNIDGVLTCP